MLIVCIASFAFAASYAFDLARKSSKFGADGETAGSVITLEWEQLIPPSIKGYSRYDHARHCQAFSGHGVGEVVSRGWWKLAEAA